MRAALRAADGDVAAAAVALQCTERNLYKRIERDPKLFSLYGGRRPMDPDIATPTKHDSKTRGASDAPVVIAERATELIDAITTFDRAEYREALKKFGLSEKSLDRMKALDGLANGSGKFLSVTLQFQFQNYAGQLHMLAQVAEDMRERYLVDRFVDGPDGKPVPVSPCSDEERIGFYKVYTEMVKEQGNGARWVMEATQAMVKMFAAANGESSGTGGKKPKLGHSGPRSVNNA